MAAGKNVPSRPACHGQVIIWNQHGSIATYDFLLEIHSVCLIYLGLPSFDTVIINSRVNLTRQLHCSNNSVIRQLCQTTCNLDFIDFMYFCISNVYICPLSIFYVLWAKCLK